MNLEPAFSSESLRGRKRQTTLMLHSFASIADIFNDYWIGWLLSDNGVQQTNDNRWANESRYHMSVSGGQRVHNRVVTTLVCQQWRVALMVDIPVLALTTTALNSQFSTLNALHIQFTPSTDGLSLSISDSLQTLQTVVIRVDGSLTTAGGHNTSDSLTDIHWFAIVWTIMAFKESKQYCSNEMYHL